MEKINEIYDQMQAIVDIMQDGPKKHKAQKEIDIVRVVTSAALIVSDNLSKLPKIDNRKRIFRGFERTPKRRLKRMKQRKDAAYLLAKSVRDIYMASANITRIQMSPIPSYVQGRNHVSGRISGIESDYIWFNEHKVVDCILPMPRSTYIEISPIPNATKDSLNITTFKNIQQ